LALYCKKTLSHFYPLFVYSNHYARYILKYPYFQGRSVSSSSLQELFGIEDNHRPNVPTFQLTSPLAGKIAAVIESIREKSPTKQPVAIVAVGLTEADDEITDSI